jgi:hypothetical protein
LHLNLPNIEDAASVMTALAALLKSQALPLDGRGRRAAVQLVEFVRASRRPDHHRESMVEWGRQANWRPSPEFRISWLNGLAYALPYRRFVDVLANGNARLGVDVVRYAFIVSDFHRLLLAGLPAHFESDMPSHGVGLRAVSRSDALSTWREDQFPIPIRDPQWPRFSR